MVEPYIVEAIETIHRMLDALTEAHGEVHMIVGDREIVICGKNEEMLL